MIKQCHTAHPFSEWEKQAMSASNLVTWKSVMKTLSMNSNTILQGYKITLNWEKTL